MSCQLPWNGLERYWTFVWETPVWFSALRRCKSTSESLPTQHPQPPFLSPSFQRYTCISPGWARIAWNQGCERFENWSAMKCYASLPLWCQLGSTQEPSGSRGCCLPSQHPCPDPSLLTESQLCSGSRWLSLWYSGMIMTDLKESWKSRRFFAGLRQAGEPIHTYNTRSEALQGMVASLSMGYSSLT